jgi:DNA-binding response OmpR family regulator
MSMNENLTDSRILIIEDNPSNVDQLEQLLELNGFEQFTSLTDSRDAAEALTSFSPDLILLDLYMPYLDGFEVLEHIKQRHSEDDFLPVIVLTADINPESRERALKLGAMDFLNKPYDFTETILRITNLLRTRRLHLQLQNYNDLLETKVQERTAELRKFQSELVAQERYKAMGQMASGIVHDFSNVIAVMMGHSELYLSFPDLMSDHVRLTEAFQNISTAAEDASSIVRHLREFYKSYSQEGDLEPVVELDVAIRGALALTRPRWRDQAQSEGRHINISTEVDTTQILMTPSNTREILTNLIFNAVDAMPKGGTITIKGFQQGDIWRDRGH